MLPRNQENLFHKLLVYLAVKVGTTPEEQFVFLLSYSLELPARNIATLKQLNIFT